MEQAEQAVVLGYGFHTVPVQLLRYPDNRLAVDILLQRVQKEAMFRRERCGRPAHGHVYRSLNVRIGHGPLFHARANSWYNANIFFA